MFKALFLQRYLFFLNVPLIVVSTSPRRNLVSTILYAIYYEIYLREPDVCIWFNLLSDSVAFTNSVQPELEKDMREVNVLIF